MRGLGDPQHAEDEQKPARHAEQDVDGGTDEGERAEVEIVDRLEKGSQREQSGTGVGSQKHPGKEG